jgi:hypothetical protein
VDIQREGAHQPHSVTVPRIITQDLNGKNQAPLFPPHDFHVKVSKYVLKDLVLKFRNLFEGIRFYQAIYS